jgi:hypothetical protein
MGLYWVPTGALGIVLLLAVAVVSAAHVRRLLQTAARARSRTVAAVTPLRSEMQAIKARR